MGFGRFIAATVAGTLPRPLFYACLGQKAPQYAWILPVASGLMIASTITFTLLRWRKRRPTDVPPAVSTKEATRTGHARLRLAISYQTRWGD
jgi:hypothetical protein